MEGNVGRLCLPSPPPKGFALRNPVIWAAFAAQRWVGGDGGVRGALRGEVSLRVFPVTPQAQGEIFFVGKEIC